MSLKNMLKNRAPPTSFQSKNPEQRTLSFTQAPGSGRLLFVAAVAVTVATQLR
jgi:hypothetical protein